MIVPHNIYIHVPYCMSKCNYCAFFSHACATPDWDTYANGIISEIDAWANKLGNINVPTIFFGGGTPSLMPTHVFAKIMLHIAKRFYIAHDAEITIESNPGTLDGGRLGKFISAGVNRLSVGVQSLDDKKLAFMGRRHTADDALILLDVAQNSGIHVSADFIYGLPGDTAMTITQMCDDINKLGLQHVSMYELTIEENTLFGKMNLQMPSNTEMADMYNTIEKNLALPRYEVSNYAAPGNECRHNQNVWDGQPYIGIGVGAAGRILIDGTWYEQRGGGAEFGPMTTHDRAIEMVITGMRTMRGVKITNPIAEILNKDYIKSHPELITERADGRIAATRDGILILDDLLVNIIK